MDKCKLLFTSLAIGSSLLLIGSSLLLAQKAQDSSGLVPVETVVTVEARHGKDVPTLNVEDVLAYERHERLQVTNLTAFRGENAALELFFLLDDASNSSLGVQLADLKQFMENQPGTTAIGVGYMRNGTVAITQDLTTDHARAAHSLRLPLSSPGVMASPYLSLSDLMKRWPGNAARRAVVMVTSGIDPLGGTGPMNPYLDTAIEDAQRRGVVVYSIYTPAAGHAGHSFFSMNWGQNNLSQISEETGGEAYMLGFGPPVSFAPYLTEIADHLSHQYRVTILVKPEKRAGLQSVRFTTEVPNAELVSAAKVYVSADR